MQKVLEWFGLILDLYLERILGWLPVFSVLLSSCSFASYNHLKVCGKEISILFWSFLELLGGSVQRSSLLFLHLASCYQSGGREEMTKNWTEASNRAVRRSSPFLAPFNVKMSLSRTSPLIVCLVMWSGSGHNFLELFLPDTKLYLKEQTFWFFFSSPFIFIFVITPRLIQLKPFSH